LRKEIRFWVWSYNDDYKIQELPPSIKFTTKPMVCESLGKGLVVQGEDVSPFVHPI
jgi:hypothetical protein